MVEPVKNNVTYYRLLKDKHFVGFRREVVEFLPLTSDSWRFTPIDHDHAERLSRPAVGISSLKRPNLRQIDRRSKLSRKSTKR